jgi:hypothetical protein
MLSDEATGIEIDGGVQSPERDRVRPDKVQEVCEACIHPRWSAPYTEAVTAAVTKTLLVQRCLVCGWVRVI